MADEGNVDSLSTIKRGGPVRSVPNVPAGMGMEAGFGTGKVKDTMLDPELIRVDWQAVKDHGAGSVEDYIDEHREGLPEEFDVIDLKRLHLAMKKFGVGGEYDLDDIRTRSIDAQRLIELMASMNRERFGDVMDEWEGMRKYEISVDNYEAKRGVVDVVSVDLERVKNKNLKGELEAKGGAEFVMDALKDPGTKLVVYPRNKKGKLPVRLGIDGVQIPVGSFYAMLGVSDRRTNLGEFYVFLRDHLRVAGKPVERERITVAE